MCVHVLSDFHILHLLSNLNKLCKYYNLTGEEIDSGRTQMISQTAHKITSRVGIQSSVLSDTSVLCLSTSSSVQLQKFALLSLPKGTFYSIMPHLTL